MKKKSVLRYLFAVCLAAVCFLTGCGNVTEEPDENSNNKLEITVLSIGKADAVLVCADDAVMLIDSGEADDEKTIMSELKQRGIDHIDYFQITHFDKDHVGSAAAIVNEFEIENIAYPDYESTRSEYSEFMNAVSGKENAAAVSDITQVELGSASLTVYPASDPESFVSDDKEYDNELSLVTRMEYDGRVFLFCGDVEKKRLKQMLAQDIDWKCDWIKLPHHGKYCKSMEDFMNAAAPQYSVMTVSKSEPADPEIIELLSELNVESYDTLGGNVVTVCEGGNITVSINN